MQGMGEESGISERQVRAIRGWLIAFITGLILSGVTAFPLVHETQWLDAALHTSVLRGVADSTHLLAWVDRVQSALVATATQYPFLAYGTDWLAFAHLVLAIVFLGPLVDPVRNKWVLQFGLIACAAVIPLALIAGPVRGIPLPWRLVDCSFGVFGSVPLWMALRGVRALEAERADPMATRALEVPKLSG